ncbi:hypothetical protein DFH08DRAFT_804179 [Mycena albidolilacea]|uniref:Uncharacterized protein n=1 Tax=Mycena albidolilacea TaxID=1033008 RepID=A0AAD7ACQ3_9AGAR|nr:hypothetical protein DFH08DRAFT_804179 [Mycena albidolilacea]
MQGHVGLQQDQHGKLKIAEMDAQRQICWSTQMQLAMTSECQNGPFEEEWDKLRKICNKIKVLTKNRIIGQRRQYKDPLEDQRRNACKLCADSGAHHDWASATNFDKMVGKIDKWRDEVFNWMDDLLVPGIDSFASHVCWVHAHPPPGSENLSEEW